MMNLNSIFRIADGVRVREEDFGLLLVSKSTPALALNPDLKRVWELIDGRRSLDEVSKIIAEEYSGDDMAVKIEEVFEKLLKLNLIEQIEN